jgi:Zn-dependent M16 (insulinase) family peptidase
VSQFLHGVDDDMRQKNRDRIFACGKQDLIDVTQKYLFKKPYAATILGPDSPKFTIDGQFRQVKNVQMPEIGE